MMARTNIAPTMIDSSLTTRTVSCCVKNARRGLTDKRAIGSNDLRRARDLDAKVHHNLTVEGTIHAPGCVY